MRIQRKTLNRRAGNLTLSKNRCYTYFRIIGDFDPDAIAARLGLKPDKSVRAGDLRGDGSVYDCSSLMFGRCNEYEVCTGNQMRKTISCLLDKTDELKRIKNELDLSYYLEIAPTIFVDEPGPCLSPPLDIIDFCHETRTEIDIDYYLLESESK